MNAALISIVTEWLSDLKMGYCSDGWWLNQQFCCWEIEEDEEIACKSWKPWSDYTMMRWMIYVSFAVSNANSVTFCPYNDGCIGVISIHCFSSGPYIGEICCWLWNIRDQMHLGWLRDARIPGLLNTIRQINSISKVSYS
jgi:hypothetical protein